MSIPSTAIVLTPQDLEYLSVSGVYGQVEQYSLQSLVELVYVKQGNDLLANAMSNLQTALTSAQGALSVLTDIQTLHNKITIPSSQSFSAVFPFNFKVDNQQVTVNSWTIFSTNGQNSAVSYHVFIEPKRADLPNATSFSADPTFTFNITDADSYRSAYNALASAYFIPIDPTVVGNLSAMGSYLTQMASAKARMAGFMSALNGLPSSLRSGALPLLGRLSAVFGSLPSATTSAFEKWVLDGNDLHGTAGVEKAGSIQADLNTAITAAESLNSAQNQVVRNFTFQFQQYMQSAASILTALNQLFTTISANISKT